MKKTVPFVFFVVFASLLGAGCFDQKQAEELARARAETEAANLKLLKAEAEIALLKGALAETRNELERLTGKKKPEPEEPTLYQKVTSLKAHYDQNAITADEFTKLKARLIEQIPAKASATEKRSLGERLLELKKAFDGSAITADEWSKIKVRVIAQAPSLSALPVSLDRELTDLKKAYDASAVTADEWAKAKAEVTKSAR